jgi:hypothetical protein
MTDSNPPAGVVELPRGANRPGWAGVLPFLGGARWGRAMAARAGLSLAVLACRALALAAMVSTRA